MKNSLTKIQNTSFFLLVCFLSSVCLWGCCHWGKSLEGKFDEGIYNEVIGKKLDFHSVYEHCNQGYCEFFRFFEDGRAYKSPTYSIHERDTIDYTSLNLYLPNGDMGSFPRGDASYYLITKKGNIKVGYQLLGMGTGYRYIYFKIENGTLTFIAWGDTCGSEPLTYVDFKLTKIDIEVDSTRAWW